MVREPIGFGQWGPTGSQGAVRGQVQILGHHPLDAVRRVHTLGSVDNGFARSMAAVHTAVDGRQFKSTAVTVLRRALVWKSGLPRGSSRR